MSRQKSLEVQEFPADALREHLTQVSFPRTRWPCEEKYSDRLSSLLKRETPPNLRGNVVTNRILTHDLAFEEFRQSVRVDVNSIDFFRHPPLNLLAIA